MRKTYTKLGLVLGAVVLTGGLTACGSDSDGGSTANPDKSADNGSDGGSDNGIADGSGNDVAEKAADTLKKATSLKVDMKMRDDDGDIAITLAVDKDNNCAGTVGMGDKGKAEIIKQGEKVWMKPDTAFWQAQGGEGGAAANQVIGDRYLVGTTEDQMMSGLAGTCDLSEIRDGDSTDKAEGWSDPKETTTDGQKVVVIEREKDGTKTALHVLTEGDPYPVQAVKSGAENGTIKYSDYNKPVPTQTPSADKSLNVAELEKIGQ